MIANTGTKQLHYKRVGKILRQTMSKVRRHAEANGSYPWGVDEIGAARSAQKFFHFLDGFANCFANYAV